MDVALRYVAPVRVAGFEDMPGLKRRDRVDSENQVGRKEKYRCLQVNVDAVLLVLNDYNKPGA